MTTETPLPAHNSAGPVPENLMRAIEETWKGRAKTRDLTNPKSAKYRTLEVEFFIGAMAALAMQGYEMPPLWTMNILGGRNACERRTG